MDYILVLITTLQMGGIGIEEMGTFPNMFTCFDERELLVEKLGRPIINYQVICIVRKVEV